MNTRREGNIEWEEEARDRFAAWRQVAGERQRVGTVLRHGTGWYWAPEGVSPLYGPVPTREEAARHLAAGMPGVVANIHPPS